MDLLTKPGGANIGAVINHGGRYPISSMSYHESGKRLFVASNGDSKLHIIDCINGKIHQPSLKCERETISIVTATHHENNVLFAPGKGGGGGQQQTTKHTINYWSVYDNKIIRKFVGHTDTITSISMCPADDTFLTSSVDQTVRLWNTSQSSGCLAEMKLPSTVTESTTTTNNTTASPLAAFDSTGLVFAITAPMKDRVGQYVHLYDARNANAGAFAEFKVMYNDIQNNVVTNHPTIPIDRATQLCQGNWTSVQFNVSGNQILAGTDRGTSILLDGFEGTVQHVIVPPHGGKVVSDRPAVSCITPDDKVLLQGNEDGTISCYNIENNNICSTITTLQGHTGPITCIAANPKYSQFASTCTHTALWI